jgi:spermidine/putrescine transport system ATP-binding protein
MRGASVELADVSKSFAHHPVVRDVSLKIGRGEFFSLLGPSGCGKTTTLRLIAGFERPDRGEIRYDGKLRDDAGRDQPAYVRDINLVFQHYALFPHMSVAGNVAFGLEMERLPAVEIQRRVREALELVHLVGLEARYPKQLSGGQQQRVALARAIVTEPSILLLDEPLGALDLKLRKAMQLELKSLQRRLGLTFVHVTHDQEEALAMSDRIAVMHNGRVLQVGTPGEIYERPATRFVAEFIGESNLLEGQVTGRNGTSATVAVNGITLEVVARDLAERVNLLIRPEKISLGTTAGPAANCVAGTIEDSLFFGTDTQYCVRVGESLRLTVRQQNLGHAPYCRGDRVYASWSAEAISPIAADPPP